MIALLDRMLRGLVTDGELVLRVGAAEYRYGPPRGARPPVAVRIDGARTAWAIARNPALGAGEAYMSGALVVEEGDVLDLLDLVGHNARWDRGNPLRVALWRRTRALSWLGQLNRLGRSRSNVAHHYDLDGGLYDLFLDPELQYSCAYFRDPDGSLERAQLDKMAHVAAKLALGPGQRVLDIGCGWGGLAIHLARSADVEVLGVTLSERQLEVARRRAAVAGVADRVRFELRDYREVEGRFDRIVSVGMLEHVGRPNYGGFFAKVAELLAPDGVALVHTIGRADGPGSTDPWTAKWIFPGGYAPALSELMPAIERSWLWTADVETLRLHYAYTLEEWYDRTLAARDAVVALYDERFLRMWLFYLAAAICAFRHDGHVVYQIQLAGSRDALPITRDYLYRSR